MTGNYGLWLQSPNLIRKENILESRKKRWGGALWSSGVYAGEPALL
jgi:hypothetical protein